MPRTRLVAVALVAIGAIALAAGGALVFLKVHHTLGTGSVAIGVVLELAGVATAFIGRMSGRAKVAKGAPRWSSGSRLQGVIAAIIIGGATFGSYLYVSSQVSAQSSSHPGLTLDVNSASEITYPNGNVGVNVQVSAVGGVPPYSFTAYWGDNANQSSANGNFTRVFGAAAQLSTTLTITAKSVSHAVGSLFLSLPSQVPAASGGVSTRTLSIVSSNTARGLPPGPATTSTQTAGTSTFIAIISGSTTAAPGGVSSSATTSVSSTAISSGSTTVSGSGGFEVTVVVSSAGGQPIEGATVNLDGGTSLSTSASGTAVFYGVPGGLHSFVVGYGSFSVQIPYVAAQGSPAKIFVTVPS